MQYSKYKIIIDLESKKVQGLRIGDVELIILMHDNKAQLLTTATDPNLAVQLSGYATQIIIHR